RDAGGLPVGAGGYDVYHDDAGVGSGLSGVAQAIGIHGLEQDGVIALGHALLDLADLLGSVLIGAQNVQLHTQLIGLRLCALGDADLERVGLVLLDEGNLIGAVSALGGRIPTSALLGGLGAAAAAGEGGQRHGAGQQQSQKLLLFHVLSSLKCLVHFDIYQEQDGERPSLNTVQRFLLLPFTSISTAS
ncbi:Mg2+ and Co2+ transporter CorB, partial [Dysosmobacter welbionis]